MRWRGVACGGVPWEPRCRILHCGSLAAFCHTTARHLTQGSCPPAPAVCIYHCVSIRSLLHRPALAALACPWPRQCMCLRTNVLPAALHARVARRAPCLLFTACFTAPPYCLNLLYRLQGPGLGGHVPVQGHHPARHPLRCWWVWVWVSGPAAPCVALLRGRAQPCSPCHACRHPA